MRPNTVPILAYKTRGGGRRKRRPTDNPRRCITVYRCLVSATPSAPPPSQQALAKRAAHERAAGPDRVISGAVDLGRELGVDLDEVDGDEAARLVHALADEVALAQRQPAPNRRARRRRPHGVERVHVERQVDGRVAADVRQRHVHDAPDAVSVVSLSAWPRVNNKRKRGITHRSMSNMLKALIPCSLKILFSPASTSLNPIYTTFLKLTRCSSPNHPKNSCFSSLANPVKKLTGIPCTFPLSLVSGVLISACASTQISATSLPSLSLTAFAVPATDPIAME